MHFWEPTSKYAPIESGGVAQLGEHLPCKQGVSSSIPLVSTNNSVTIAVRFHLFPYRTQQLGLYTRRLAVYLNVNLSYHFISVTRRLKSKPRSGIIAGNGLGE